MADAARDSRAWREAVSHYQAAVSLRPEELGLNVQLGHALKELGRYEEAQRQYEVFRKRNPVDVDIHLQLGHLQTKQRNFPEALGWYGEALKLCASGRVLGSEVCGGTACHNLEIEIRRSAALVLADSGKWSEAAAELSRLVKKDAQLDLSGRLVIALEEAGLSSEIESHFFDYRNNAGKLSTEAFIEANIQSGIFEKSRSEYSAALSFFIAAKNLLERQSPWMPELGAVRDEIEYCKKEVFSHLL